ncbi:MAG: hypothetical protein JRN15_12630 [Nitrososphaerota archaeon]|nr:hypothetical protein [Nitrososphaerota archaeon]
MLIAIKNYSLNDVIESVRILSQRRAPIVSFPNGIGQLDQIWRTV